MGIPLGTGVFFPYWDAIRRHAEEKSLGKSMKCQLHSRQKFQPLTGLFLAGFRLTDLDGAVVLTGFLTREKQSRERKRKEKLKRQDKASENNISKRYLVYSDVVCRPHTVPKARMETRGGGACVHSSTKYGLG